MRVRVTEVKWEEISEELVITYNIKEQRSKKEKRLWTEVGYVAREHIMMID